MLLSPQNKYTSIPLSVTDKSFEHHYVMLTDPITAFLVVLYRPPGPLADFVEELDMLLSALPDDGTPLILFGDFPNQSGFKTGHSTETALLSVITALQSAKAASRSSVIILLHLSAAFDTAIRSCLPDSLRWASLALHFSGSHPTCRGDPTRSPGEVLGPHLFSLYTTSLGPIITSHGFSYHCYPLGSPSTASGRSGDTCLSIPPSC